MAVSIEVDGVRISDGEVRTFYFTTDGYTTHANDIPSNTYFDPRIKQLPVLARAMFETVGTNGASRSAIGDVELLNHDGELDYLITDYAFDGQDIRCKTGDWSTPYRDWSLSLAGVISNIRTDRHSLYLVFDDPLAKFNQWNRPTFEGNNDLPLGVEGTAQDLKGSVKPRVLGYVLNASPKLVNTAKLIYQVSDQPCHITEVRDMGVLITRSTDYASLNDMYEQAPKAGQFRCFEGYLRLGAQPAGTVTCYALSPDIYPDQIIKTIAKSCDLPSFQIANDQLPSVMVGVFVDGNNSAREIMDKIANSVGAWYGFDRAQQLRLGRLELPTGSPAVIWSEDCVINLNIRSISAPVWKVSLKYAHNYTPQTNMQTMIWGTDYATWAAESDRTVVVTNEVVKQRWKHASDITIDTLLVNAFDAENEAQRILSLREVPRITLELELPMSELGGIDLGAVVRVDTSRFYLYQRNFVVIGMDSVTSNTKSKLILWG